MQNLNILKSSLSLCLVSLKSTYYIPPNSALNFCADTAAADSVWGCAIVTIGLSTKVVCGYSWGISWSLTIVYCVGGTGTKVPA